MNILQSTYKKPIFQLFTDWVNHRKMLQNSPTKKQIINFGYMTNHQLNTTIVFMLFILFSSYGQNLPNVIPSTPQPSQFKPYTTTPTIHNPNPTYSNQSQRNRQQIAQYERDRQEVLRREAELKKLREDLNTKSNTVNYGLPLSTNPSTKYYREAFAKLKQMNPNDYSLKDATFTVENAYYEETQNKEEFDNVIKETGKFILRKMDDFGYDKNSNLAKNFMLFQFFSDTLQIKKDNLKHLPIKYDFEDFWGKKDWSKMFVTKLLRTNSGQCNSMPRLYLILAEEIGATAHLAFSPNHSYIKFEDEGFWYNVELTNQMFTTNSIILRSGYIKSEALQNKIYVNPLSKKELFAQVIMGLVGGYIHKFGYDDFVNEMLDEALRIYPDFNNAILIKSNYATVRTQYVFKQIGLTPENANQKIRQYPIALDVYKEMDNLYNMIDNSGYEEMPQQEYENWLNGMKEEKDKQDSEKLKNQFKLKLKPQIKG